jgi:hypothetical protein
MSFGYEVDTSRSSLISNIENDCPDFTASLDV